MVKSRKQQWILAPHQHLQQHSDHKVRSHHGYMVYSVGSAYIWTGCSRLYIPDPANYLTTEISVFWIKYVSRLKLDWSVTGFKHRNCSEAVGQPIDSLFLQGLVSNDTVSILSNGYITQEIAKVFLLTLKYLCFFFYQIWIKSFRMHRS